MFGIKFKNNDQSDSQAGDDKGGMPNRKKLIIGGVGALVLVILMAIGGAIFYEDLFGGEAVVPGSTKGTVTNPQPGHGQQGGGTLTSGGKARTGVQAVMAWVKTNRTMVIAIAVTLLVLSIAAITAAILLSTSTTPIVPFVEPEPPIHHGPENGGGLILPSALTIALFVVGFLLFASGTGMLIKDRMT